MAMRNLLGRLHARTPADTARIAAFWRVPLTAPDQHGQVGQLYRALSDPRAVRDAWERLDPPARALVRLLAVGDEAALTLADIAARLDVAEAGAHETAARLYRAGILAREGDDEPLPVGTAPRLFLPRELALLFRRVQDEIEAGDLSTTPLRALIELFDAGEIEEAARLWGLTVIPGLRQRDDLTRQLLRQVADPDRAAAVAGGRRRDAARLWQHLRHAADGAPVPLDAAAAAAGLADDDPRRRQRLRDALAELETALLVWHTYRADGSRWLFVPAEIRAPRAPTVPDLPPLQPVAAPAVPEPRWRHPDALAWDLLTTLRTLTLPDAPAWEDDAHAPRSWRRRVNATLWQRGADVPPPGYLGFLVALARAEGLLRRRQEDAPAPFETTLAIRAWRDLAFPEQTARLRTRWLDADSWIEGTASVEVWGADWSGCRRKLLPLLAELAPETWYPLDAVAARIAARAPDLLGTTFTVATARHAGRAETGDDDRRRAAVAEVVAVMLETALRWCGLVDLADIPGQGRAVRLTEAGAAPVQGQAPDAPPAAMGPPIAVLPSLDVRLHRPTPLRVWSLSAFADPAQLDRAVVYRLSPGSLARALAAGFDRSHIETFLTRQSGAPVPPEVADRLRDWTAGYRRVRLRRAVVLTPDDRAALADLQEAAEAAGLMAHPLGADALLIELPEPADGAAQSVETVLRAGGYAAQWEAPPRRGLRTED